MAIKLKKLLKEIPGLTVKGSANPDITGISNHSKTTAPGNLFIAKKGKTFDGTLFIEEAIRAGALAIVTDLYNPFLPKELVQLIHPDPKAIESKIAKAFYGSPNDHLCLVGITGTNGKTTTSYLVHHLFNALHTPCSLIGTVEWKVGTHSFPSTMTSPDILQLYKLFSEMRSCQSKACVFEVSSHALDQERIKGIAVDIAVFTNLTQDHLDYHLTMENYALAKAKLFSSYLPTPPKKGFAIVNGDDAMASSILAHTKREVITYGLKEKADLHLKKYAISSQGSQGVLAFLGKEYPFTTSLCGKFNLYNLLAAVGVGLASGFEMETLLETLHRFESVPGRLEKVINPLGLQVFVDYAHTHDALCNVLTTLKEIAKGRVITVFGCGGSRDRDKRPKMGKVVEELSDIGILTSDNPRNEDPQEIAKEVLAGIAQQDKMIVELDRAKAIEKAIRLASADDIVLIAGKGHEKYQIFSHQTLKFDDREEALKACHSLKS